MLQYQIRLSHELKLPLLNVLKLYDDRQLAEIGRKSLLDLLLALEENRGSVYIQQTVQRWIANDLESIKSDQIKAEDITIINFIRKQAFVHFLKQYTADIEEIVMIIHELDSFLLEQENQFINTYIHVFQRSLLEQEQRTHQIRLNQTQIEQELRENKDFLEKIADATPTVLFLFDVKQEKLIYVNQEILNALGYSREEIMDMPLNRLMELYHPSDVIGVLPRLQQYNTEEVNQVEYECRLRHKNGEFRWALIRENVFKRNSRGKVLSVLGAGLDISQRKEVEGKLFQKTNELQQSNTSLEEFAYVASHDLQEPLRKISTFGDRLLTTEQANLSKDGQLYLSKIISSSLHMQRMINDLLSISVISSDKTFEQTSLKALFEEAIQLLEYKIDEKKASIEIGNLPKARVIPSQFRQLFQNLISNSLKFSKPGELPVITVKHRYIANTGQLRMTSSDGGRLHEIRVTDNGIGFENRFSEKIFTIFQRLHNRHQYPGTGIGLAICKKIVENHGGNIFADSKVDIGTTFTIMLPA